MAAPERTERTERTDDEAMLHRLGYAQVLYREMGGFSNFAISFTIISILAGCLTSYYLAFNNGGPVAITWGWLLVGAFCILVAMAMGEIASAMPTAGALYFWASKLGGPACGWFTGWFNLVGEIAVTAAIQYGSAIFTTALLNLWFPGMGNETGTIFVVFTAIAALQLGLNLLNINVLALLNTVSAWWHMAGVAVIVLVLILVPDNHQSAAFVFGETINNSGFSDNAFWFVFGIGLLMSQYTITGYDASAHMSEETRSASRTAALGMVMAVVASVVFGFILLVAVTFAVPDVQGVVDAGGDAVIYIWTEALGETWAQFLLLIAVIAQLFCGTASVTASSRMLFAFSRDQAVPFSQVWRKVASNRAPVNAVIAICVLSWALMLPTLVNGVLGYAVGTSIAVIGLYIAFAIPIILRIKAGDRFEPGAWTLGRHYKWISTIAVVWIALVCILFLMPLSPAGVPFSSEFDWEAMNYAPITVFGALILFGGWYLISAHKWFTGPVREGGSVAELKSIEDLLAAESAGTAPAALAATAGAGGALAVADTKTDTKTDTKSDTDAAAARGSATDGKAEASEDAKSTETEADSKVIDATTESTDVDSKVADTEADSAEADTKVADTTVADTTTAAEVQAGSAPGAGTGSTTDAVTTAQPATDADPAPRGDSRTDSDAASRAELKEELKAELKEELKAELLAELTAAAANGKPKRAPRTTRAKAGTTASAAADSTAAPTARSTSRSRSTSASGSRSRSRSTANGAAGPTPDAEPETDGPAK